MKILYMCAANSIATGAGLNVLIQTIGHISRALFNPVVRVVEHPEMRLSTKEMASYMFFQVMGQLINEFPQTTWRFKENSATKRFRLFSSLLNNLTTKDS